MTPERWQQVKDILHGAMQKEPHERSTFLDQACKDDPSLKPEVESLLASKLGDIDDLLQSALPNRVALGKGARLGAYEIVSLIGAGGMGEVYRARDTALKRDVAIKVLPDSYTSDPGRSRRLQQEAEATAALNHPNILTIYQVGRENGTLYIAAELLHGETLREKLLAGHLPLRSAIEYGVQMARGLAAAHELGIVHRDLKPENVFITKNGHLKILDFGLAKLGQHMSDFSDEARTQTLATEPGVVLGTVAYMSPEQVQGKATDHRSDIFSFGEVLYEMLAGRRAFQKPSAVETMNAILTEDPPAISQVAPNVPMALQRVVHRCLEKNPEQRFHAASDVGYALEAMSDSGGFPMVSAAAAKRPRWQKWLLAGAAVGVIAIGRNPGRAPQVRRRSTTFGGCNPAAAWRWILGYTHTSCRDLPEWRIPPLSSQREAGRRVDRRRDQADDGLVSEMIQVVRARLLPLAVVAESSSAVIAEAASTPAPASVPTELTISMGRRSYHQHKSPECSVPAVHATSLYGSQIT